MKKEQILGQLRELLTAGAAAMVAYNVGDGFDATALIGAVIAIVAVVWSIRSHEGWSLVVSLIRKALSATGGAMVAYGLMNDTQSTALLATVGPLLSMVGSWRANGDGSSRPGSGLPLLLLGALAVFCLLPSCTVSVGPDGAYGVIVDPVAAGTLVTHILEEK